MSSPTSASNVAFERLHPDLRRWIWEQRWPALRPIQADAIPIVLDRTHDVVITAPTAGGKTEAAFLPILSDLADLNRHDQLGALCVSPLRALINDQSRRLESMTEAVGLRVQAWHGDIGAGRSTFWKRPAAVLITTPESLEAMLMRRSRDLSPLARTLRYLVVDELHSFIGSERGAQLQSLLRRVEHLAGAEIPRIALSATLSDPTYAGEFLRPSLSRPVAVVRPSQSAGSDLRVVLKAVLEPDQPVLAKTRPTIPQSLETVDDLPVPPLSTPTPPIGDDATPADPLMTGGIAAIAEQLFRRLRGDTHLVFANSRARVEILASLLSGLCETERLPNEFFAHHGSLSKDIRLEVEQRLREGQLPTTAICTSTLEMGIDLGDVASVAQVGPAPSVSALKQRVGRSGRRPGTVQTLRQYIQLRTLTDRDHAVDQLRLPLVQAIAHLELMAEGRYEPPTRGDLHLSTLVQQILSSIYASGGGASPKDLWSQLGGPGPFAEVPMSVYAAVLRAMGQSKLLEQTADGVLLPGELGEKIADHYTFYASFATPEEFTLLASGRPIGRLPIDSLVVPGQFLLFGGRRWRVVEARLAEKTILLEPARGGQPPDFSGGAPLGHRIVHERMRDVLTGAQQFSYLDEVAVEVLASARAAFTCFALGEQSFLRSGDECYIAHWSGSRGGRTLALILQHQGLSVEDDGPFLCVTGSSTESVSQAIRLAVDEAEHFSVDSVMALVPILAEEKFEPWLQSDRPLLERAWAARWLDLSAAHTTLKTLAAEMSSQAI